MNCEHSKPIHVFREGSRECVCARIRNGGKGKLQAQEEQEREPIKEGVGWDDFKTEYAGAHDATSYVNEIVSIVFSRWGVVSLSVLRGLIEKQRLQFCKIRTSATDVDTRVLHLARALTAFPQLNLFKTYKRARKFLSRFVARCIHWQ